LDAFLFGDFISFIEFAEEDVRAWKKDKIIAHMAKRKRTSEILTPNRCAAMSW
jgi:hypothetical protein